MSHSRKYTPIFTYAGSSNKLSKTVCNCKFRKRSRMVVLKDADCPVRLDEVMTEWEFNGNGKHYLKTPEEKDMRK